MGFQDIELRFSYSSPDGTFRQESAVPNPEGGHTSKGSFSYVGPDGQVYELAFEAGINGYQ